MQREQDGADAGLSILIGAMRAGGLMMSLRSAAIAADGSSASAPPAPVANIASAIRNARFRNATMPLAFQFHAGCPACRSTSTRN
jgi:hypothetical protein